MKPIVVPVLTFALFFLTAGYIQACRGLMISAVCLGFFGAIFGLVGMKCTKVGGSDQTKAKIACLAGLIFILSGKYTLCLSVYVFEVISELLLFRRNPGTVLHDFIGFRVRHKALLLAPLNGLSYAFQGCAL